MTETEIISKVNECLHKATTLLADWLNLRLPRITDNWWNECVISKLSYNQTVIAETKKYSQLSDFDLAMLLRIADKNWYAMRNYEYLPTKERECIKDMISVRNNWAHCGSALPGKDTVLRDLNILLLFFEQMGCSLQQTAEIERFIIQVEKEKFDTVSEPIIITERQNSVVIEDIKERDKVYLISDPTQIGIVFSVTNIGDSTKYEVFINGNINTFYSGQIALVEQKTAYQWVNIDTFQSKLSAYQINNPSASNLYSLNSARIDFVPYQFRPALKIIKSDEPKILIADSVGVGKTIEAGLIIKELEARNELENVMIICPKPLVTERKWELEMKRFDEEFIPLKGAELRQIISDTDRDGEWPLRYGKTIVPYSILDAKTYEGEESKRGKIYGLKDLDPAPHFDLVIVDEAHHIRNGSMKKDKAYAYKCVKYFCDHADAVVMLTATPLQNSNDDLFTLMNVLRPDVIIDRDTFNLMMRPNAYVSRCSHIVRAAEDNCQQEAILELEGVTSTQWGENVIAKNPLYSSIMERLQRKSLSREERIELITDIESLHSFNTMLNRTRRKDIQDFCVRHSHTLETQFTPMQKQLHDELLNFERAALTTLHDARSVPFMMSTIRRQAASCIFGLAPYLRDLINKRFDQLIDDPEIDIDNVASYEKVSLFLGQMADNIISLAENLPEDDPKFDSVYAMISEKQQSGNNKIILFSTFRHTLAYIRKKLLAKGLRVAQIDGSVNDDMRRSLRDRFEKEKNDPDALDILLFTEVGSEGLDYQFCNMMINYDLPWNPMRIEQRIGRIDRRGQKSEVVNIYNVITSETVDADIYNRCLMRIGVFERSIGDCEEILGEIGSQIESIATDSRLTESERRKKLEDMADNEVRKLKELSRLENEGKGLFGFDLSSYTVAKDVQEAESPWLTPSSLQFLVQRYLVAKLGEGNYLLGNGEIKTLKLSLSARATLKEDFRKLSGSRSAIKRMWEHYLKGNNPNLPLTFVQESAEQNREIQFITAVHPLVKQAAKYFEENEILYVNLKCSSDSIQKGTYPFSVYAWNYTGFKSKFKLQIVCNNGNVSSEWNDLLQEATSCPIDFNITGDEWKLLENTHFELWQKEKASYIESAKALTAYRMESLCGSFENRKRILEQKIADSIDTSIARMFQSHLEDIIEKHTIQVDKIKQKEMQSDIHVALIANGFITIE